MIKVGVVGGTGYTGVELLRLLAQHPDVSLEVITSRSETGVLVSDMFPNLRGHIDLAFTEPDVDALANCDLVFFATPNGVAMKLVPDLLEKGVKVIDLAADFRLKSEADWTKWYGMPHACPELLSEAVYGLPEMNRKLIAGARLVANPGCYPTSVQLGYAPLLKHGLIDATDLIADCKSGISGAGRAASVVNLQAESSESVKAYAVAGHRHRPEIVQGLQAFNIDVGLTFVPHLMPMIRGIHSTLYASLLDISVDLQALYEKHYKNEPFVDVMSAGSTPETRSVKGSNMCRIALYRLEDQPQDRNKVIVLSVIDNLLKGAAGQAIQNMNIMFNVEETKGIESIAILP